MKKKINKIARYLPWHISSRLSTEAHGNFNGGLNGHFDELTLSSRTSELVRRYGELYSGIRVDALDALDRIGQLSDLSVLKEKILFSVVVVRESDNSKIWKST